MRFQKKLPCTAQDVTAGEIIIALMRLRGSTNSNIVCKGFLVRLCHSWAQHIETTMPQVLHQTCPDPNIQAKVHPFLKASRSRGNKALEMTLLQRFQSRGGGYISGRDCNLAELGLVSSNSQLGTKTCAEFTTRILCKTAEFMQSQFLNCRVVNFTFDCAYVSEEQVPRLKICLNSRHQKS